MGTAPDDVVVTSAAERPDLRSRIWEMPDSWPAFMDHDPISDALFGAVASARPELVLLALRDGEIVAHATAIAFRLDADGRRTLPSTGWDRTLVWASRDLRFGEEPDTASALEVSVRPDLQGHGLSALMVGAMRDAAAASGFSTLLAPVRPSEKHLEPHTPMSEYAGRTRDDGLPADAWLRVHVRLGGVIEQIAPASQTITGSLAEWREWTGEPFDRSGDVVIPYGLAPVHVSLTHDRAVYVEPNVWVRHDL